MAAERLRHPQPIDGPVMFGTAVLGVIVNVVLAATLHSHSHSHGAHSHGGDASDGGGRHAHDHHDDHETGHTHGHDHGHGHGHADGTHERDLEASRERMPLLDGEGGTTAHAHAAKTGGWSLRGLWERVEHMDVNIRSAAVHVIGDLISSIGVVIASVVIMVRPDWTAVDPVCTFLFSVLV
ncbi:hypothetical protein HK405_005670, partial [Cladochytrium tenue]